MNMIPQPTLNGGQLFSCGSRPAAAARSLGSAARALVIVFVLALAAGLCLCVRAIEKLLHLRYGVCATQEPYRVGAGE